MLLGTSKAYLFTYVALPVADDGYIFYDWEYNEKSNASTDWNKALVHFIPCQGESILCSYFAHPSACETLG